MSASLPIDILLDYKNGIEVFVETGTSEGDSVQTALDAGFERIYSIELDPQTCERARKRFEGNSRVHIFNSSSVEGLSKIMSSFNEEILFFLDAHPDCSAGMSPILDELSVILRHEYNDVILADDMRLMGKNEWKDITVEKISRKVLEKNPAYRISLEPNGHDRKDLFAATLE